jgi:hypothetical protein
LLAGCVLALAGPACGGSARAPRPSSGVGSAGSNRVAIENGWGDEDLLDLPPGALTSEAALVTIAERETCFDVLLRTWHGAAGAWEVRAEVDGTAAAESPILLAQCRARCFQPGTHLRPLPSDHDERVRLYGGRVCFERLPVARREAVLALRQGALELRFAWGFDEGRPLARR